MRSSLPVLALSLLPLAGCFGEKEVVPPELLYGEKPVEYPLELWDEGVEGEVLLRIRVTDVGVVDSIELSRSSGHAGLDAVALEGVRDLTFDPGRLNGRRVDMWATIPIQFTKRPPAGDSP